MNIIKTTASDFCNGSLESDKSRIFCGVSLTTLIDEAVAAVKAINVAQPDDQCDLSRDDFARYYQDLENELEDDEATLLEEEFYEELV